jgi:hypothetical protein
MAYIICGKEGISPNPDFQPLCCNFELGWEVATTHVKAKRFLAQGIFNQDDVIVTLPGREFFYAATFKNVITFKEFCKVRGLPYGVPINDATESDVIDLCWEFERDWTGGSMGSWPAWYFSGPNQTYDGDAWEYVQSVREPTIKINEKYLCVAIRIRPHQSTRNASFDYAQSLLRELREAHGLPIYLVGLDLPDYGVEGVHGVSLEEWIKLLRDPNCVATIGAYTGTTASAALLAPKNHKIIVAPLNHCHTIGGNYPTGMGRCLNLNGNLRYFLQLLIPPEKVVEETKKILGS